MNIPDKYIDLQSLVFVFINRDKTDFRIDGIPLSSRKNKELKKTPSLQISTDPVSAKKYVSWYSSYKDNIGVDVESELIFKSTITPANVHNSTQTEKLVSYNEKALFGNKAYVDGHHKYLALHYAWYNGVLDKATCCQALSGSQKKRNRLRFIFACIGWNLSRAGFLLEKSIEIAFDNISTAVKDLFQAEFCNNVDDN